jgi:hypothetical protein
VSRTALSWSPLADATAYDVVRGSVAELKMSGGNYTGATKECVGNDVAATFRATNCGAGSYNESAGSQVGDRDLEIAASAFACP